MGHLNGEKTAETGTGGYSASVKLTLRVNGCVFGASHMGRDRVILRESTQLPDGPAEMIAIIDGHESRWPVRIDNRHESRQIVPVEIIKLESDLSFGAAAPVA